MKRTLLLTILASLVCLTGAANANPRKDQVEKMKRLSVLIASEGFLGGGRGSGVLLDSEHVLTCAHMVSSPSDELWIYTYPLGAVIRARVENIDFRTDLAVLKLERRVKIGMKPVFQNDVYDGEPITIVGNTLGSMKWYVTVGIVSGAEREYVLTDAQVKPGNSGGPWFNDKGEIVALTDWGLGKNTSGVSGGVSGRTINETLTEWANRKKVMAAIMSVLGGLNP